MGVTTGPVLEHRYADELPELVIEWSADVPPAPRLLALDEALADELGLDPAWLHTDPGLAFLTGAAVPEDAKPVALAYAGHQFGGFSPRLGDGRALLLGELLDPSGRRWDLHLKGSGRTPFARGGDGKAGVGPMLREFVIAASMHALGIPTTRSLAVVGTGEPVRRERLLPGALLARIASSHLRVGTFQYAAQLGPDHVRRLADHAIERHDPDLVGDRDGAVPDPDRYLAWFGRVVQRQAALVAAWMSVGFVHGVMNTDNTTISGETIDYGPCAFLDRYDPAAVFSSIDEGGRYSFRNQPRIATWNLARLAEATLTLYDVDVAKDHERAVERVTAVLQRFDAWYETARLDRFRRKLGLVSDQERDDELVDGLLHRLQMQRLDLTSTFRMLADVLRHDGATIDGLEAWLPEWRARLALEDRPGGRVADAMDRVNPANIARNHLVEAALAAASDHDDLAPFDRLVEVLRDPYTVRPGFERYTEPAPDDFGRYVTYCGT
ncbi:MAG: YdiU family protein [Ilumatobacteraceae bacterium]